MDPVAYLAREIEQLKKSQRDKGSTPQLGTSSIENGTLLEYNADGTLVGAIGRQVDGTHTQVSFNGPPPPAPTVPTVELLNGSVRVTWDGQFVDGSVAPMDLARIDVHIFTASVDPMTTPPRFSIMAQGWGDTSIPLIPDTYNAVLVAWTQSGMYTISGQSAPFTALPITVDLSVLEASQAATQAQLDAVLPITETKIALDSISSPLIKANAIIAGKIAAGTIVAADIAANTITAAKIAAGTITANELAAGSVTANKILAGSIDGMVITGATLRTAASGQRVQVDTAGLTAYNSGGVAVTTISASTGVLTASGASLTGNVRSTGTYGTSVLADGRVFFEQNGLDSAEIVLYPDSTFYIRSMDSATNAIGVSAPYGGIVLNSALAVRISSLVSASTTSSTANVYVNSVTGILARSTSSLRYKQNIFPLDLDDDAILKAEPVKWLDIAEVKKFNSGESAEISVRAFYKNGKPKTKKGKPVMETQIEFPDEPKFYSGFIAEQLHRDGLEAFVNYDEKGKPDSISYSQMIAAAVLNLRKIDRRLTALEKGNA